MSRITVGRKLEFFGKLVHQNHKRWKIEEHVDDMMFEHKRFAICQIELVVKNEGMASRFMGDLKDC